MKHGFLFQTFHTNQSFEEPKNACHNLDSYHVLMISIKSLGYCQPETERPSLTNLIKILPDRQITRRTKIKLAESLIFSIFMYGPERWTIKETENELLHQAMVLKKVTASVMDSIRNKRLSFSRHRGKRPVINTMQMTHLPIFWTHK